MATWYLDQLFITSGTVTGDWTVVAEVEGTVTGDWTVDVPSTIYIATTGSDSTGDGTSGNPYLTVDKALSVASAGDTVSVAAGTYDPQNIGSNSVARSFDTGNPVTVVASGAVVVKHVEIMRTQGVTFSGIDFWEWENATPGVANECALYLKSRTSGTRTGDTERNRYLTFSNCRTIRDQGANPQHHAGVYSDWNKCDNDHISFVNLDSNNTNYIYGTNIDINGDFHHNAMGVNVRFAGQNIVFDGCLFRNHRWDADGTGIGNVLGTYATIHPDCLQTWGTTEMETNGIVIRNCTVDETHMGQLLMSEVYPAADGYYTVRDISIYNNLIVRSGSYVYDSGDLPLLVNTKYNASPERYVGEVKVYNNTLVCLGTYGESGHIPTLASFEGGSGHIFANNLLDAVGYGYVTSDGATFTYRGNNLYHDCLGTHDSGTTLDTDDVAFDTDPLLDAEYKPSVGSPAVGAANATYEPATDLAGTTRFATTIGAYETNTETTVTGDWTIVAVLDATVTGDWTVVVETDATITGTWTVRESQLWYLTQLLPEFAGEVTGTWTVLGTRDSTVTGDWTVRAQVAEWLYDIAGSAEVTGEVTGQWTVRVTSSQTVTGDWTVVSGATVAEREVLGTWTIIAATTVDGTVTGEWTVAAILSGTVTGDWTIDTYPSGEVTGTWTVLGTRETTVTGAWTVAFGAVINSNTIEGDWTVCLPFGTVTGRWTIRYSDEVYASPIMDATADAATTLDGEATCAPSLS